MSAIQQQVESASKEYSSNFTKGDLALPPAKKYLVLTCMDARIDPAAAFGIELGDAHVIRNVGSFPQCVLYSTRGQVSRVLIMGCRQEHPPSMHFAASLFQNSC